MTDWQDISTAPRDGTWVLVYRHGRQYVARYFPNWEEWGVSAATVPDEPDAPYISLRAIEFGSAVFATGPTHWQPLPEPPKP